MISLSVSINSTISLVMQTIIACGVSYAFDFQANYGVDVVGRIPDG